MLRSLTCFQSIHHGRHQHRRRSGKVEKGLLVRSQAEGPSDGGGLLAKPVLRPPPPRPIPQPRKGQEGNVNANSEEAFKSERARPPNRFNSNGQSRRDYKDRPPRQGRNGYPNRYEGNGRPAEAGAGPEVLDGAEVVTFPDVGYQNGASSRGADVDTTELAQDVTTESPEAEALKEKPDGGNTEALADRAGGVGFRSGFREPSSSSSAPQETVPELERPPSMAPPPVRPIPVPRMDAGTMKYRKERKKLQDAEEGPEKGSANQADAGSTNGKPRFRAPGSEGQRQPGFQPERPPGGSAFRKAPFGRLSKGEQERGGKVQGASEVQSRRQSRLQRKMARQEQRNANQRVREEIFEVGPEGMPVQEVAQRLAVSPGEVVKRLFMKGIMAQVNQVLDPDTIKMVAAEFEVEVLDRDELGVENMARKTVDYIDEQDLDFLQTRPPVVTVMGHVDHGKTSLLDYIRDTKVAMGEAGGITQAIGAYTCEVPAGDSVNLITFLDTPGHEAFSAMRARGTRVTDIAIIVIAADDGVRPQTLEAIAHARAAEVPIIVAVNKVDKEGANVERVKQELAEAGLLPEEWGGTAQVVPISAKTGQGVDQLLETVLLVAEVEQLMANPDKNAVGTVIEAHLDRRTGPVASLLVAAGTLRPGDVVVAGTAYGKVRNLVSSRGEVDEAGPSLAVQMVGLNAVPSAGDDFRVCDSEQEARRQAEEELERSRLARLAEQASTTMVTTASLASMDDGDSTPLDALQRLNVIVKSDVSGTLEAIKTALSVLPQDRVALRFLLAAPSEITASDVDLAFASGGFIIGFNTEPNDAVVALAKQRGVEIVTYKVIYDLVDEMRARMEGRLASVDERLDIGEAEVRAIFGSSKGKVAGCLVTDGYLRRDCIVDVLRGRKRQVVFTGKLSSLRRVKDIVKEVPAGTECGAAVDGFLDWQEGDIISCYELRARTRTLEEASSRVPVAAA